MHILYIYNSRQCFLLIKWYIIVKLCWWTLIYVKYGNLKINYKNISTSYTIVITFIYLNTPLYMYTCNCEELLSSTSTCCGHVWLLYLYDNKMKQGFQEYIWGVQSRTSFCTYTIDWQLKPIDNNTIKDHNIEYMVPIFECGTRWHHFGSGLNMDIIL